MIKPTAAVLIAAASLGACSGQSTGASSPRLSAPLNSSGQSSSGQSNVTAPSSPNAATPLGPAASPTTEADGIALAAQDASSDAQASEARYFSLVYLQSAGLSTAQIGIARKAITKLINSLSWAASITEPTILDQSGLMLKIHLSDYNWTAATWETLVANYPAISATVTGFTALSTATGTSSPVLRGEWFVNNASVAPLYYSLLTVPTDFNQLQTLVGVDIGADVRNQTVMRAGFNNSLVSTSDRVIERHSLQNSGFLWRSYEFSGTTGNQDIFTNPLGPVRYFSGAESGATNGKPPFPGPGGFGGPNTQNTKALAGLNLNNMFSDGGGEVYFTLPNGLIAFYITDGNDTRLDTVPGTTKGQIFAGYSCMACHISGPLTKTDMVAAASASNTALKATELQVVNKLYVSTTSFTSQVQADDAAYEAALAKAGIDTSKDGDPVNAVFRMSIDEN